ncbi:MAG: MBG domain-containing protein, partial [Kiritimatiellae bacterium]|nr:MBG domain-containing protein [Kiritimatiellia bacterium]
MTRFLTIWIGAALAALSAAAAPEYWPIDLGTLGGTQSAALGLNDAGQVVGWARNAGGSIEAFVWSNGTLTGLGFLPGGTTSVARAINNHGQITGDAYVSPTNYHGFVYSNGLMTSIGTWGSAKSRPRAINDRGELAGSSPPTNYPAINNAFWWHSNQFVQIQSTMAADRSCDAYGINEDGMICGTMFLYSSNPRWWAYVWRDDNGNGSSETEETRFLGSLAVDDSGGEYSQATDVNNLGQAVGWTGITNTIFPRHAFLVTSTNGTWKDPAGTSHPFNSLMSDLGALESPDQNSYANAINDRSWIVGTSTTGSGTNQAFLWRDGVMTNLNDLIDAGSGWVLTNAAAINEYNEIAGSGLYYGQPRAFLLRSSSGLSVLGTNGAPVVDSEPPSLAKGTDFGEVLIGQARTNTFILRNLGSSNLHVHGWTTNGAGAARFEFAGIPSTVEIGGASNFTAVFWPATAGVFQAALSLDTDSPTPLTNLLFAGTGARHPQTIDFPPIDDPWATNELILSATASSGLAVAFNVAYGSAQITNNTDLTFTGAGEVGIAATQPGDDFYAPAPPVTNVFNVSKVPADVTLHDLAQTYDGTGRAASATTDPAGLVVEFTYDGLPDAPTNAGTYAVTGTVNEALWEGSATGLLTVAMADQSIDFPPIPDQWTTNSVGLAAAADSGFPVEFAVASGPAEIADLTNLTFTGTGQVAIAASQPGDANWNAAPPVTNVFTVSKRPAGVTLLDLAQTYDGTPRIVTASTEPSGLTVNLTYDGLPDAPTNAGTYAVTGTVVEAHWEGVATGLLAVARAEQTIDFPPIPDQWTTNSVGLAADATSGLAVEFSVESGPAQIADLTNLTFTGTGAVHIAATQPGDANWNPAPPVTNLFTVSKMPATVTLHDLAQTYDGTARAATATTEPAGLTVELTYDGLPDAPTNAGIYAVTGIVNEAHWEGVATGLLTVAKANQSIDFPPIADPFITNVVTLSATAGSGLPVTFEVLMGPASITNVTQLAFTSTGRVAVAASQPGDANWNPAASVTNEFEVWGLYELTVVTSHGDALPPAGIHTVLLGTELTNSIAVPEPMGGTQLVCTGWTLTTHDPAEGTTTNFILTVTNNAELTWLWTTNFWLETEAAPHGSVQPDSSWQPAREPAVLTATPDRYYHFLHWTNSASGTNNPFALIMEVPKSARAVFAENLAIHDTPEWWLAEHGWTNDFDAAALADDEPDGFPTWQEYVADTDPTNALSYPRIDWIETEGTNPPRILWPASSNRVYQVHWADGDPTAPWSTQQLFLGAAEWTDTNAP